MIFRLVFELILAAGVVPHLQESLLSLISQRSISRFWLPVRCLESSDLQVTSLTTGSLKHLRIQLMKLGPSVLCLPHFIPFY
jgi:hypothetical protein